MDFQGERLPPLIHVSGSLAVTNACHSTVEVLYYFYFGTVDDFFFGKGNLAEKWKWLDEGRGELRLERSADTHCILFQNRKR